LNGCPNVILPFVAADIIPVWHQYTIRVIGKGNDARDLLQKELSARGVETMCYYPVPLHLQKAFAKGGYKTGDFPVTEKISQQVLSLPMYPELTAEQVNRVAEAIREIMGARAATFVPPVWAQPGGTPLGPLALS